MASGRIALECSRTSACRVAVNEETITIPLALAREVASVLFGLALSQRTEGLPARADAHLRALIDARTVEVAAR